MVLFALLERSHAHRGHPVLRPLGDRKLEPIVHVPAQLHHDHERVLLGGCDLENLLARDRVGRLAQVLPYHVHKNKNKEGQRAARALTFSKSCAVIFSLSTKTYLRHHDEHRYPRKPKKTTTTSTPSLPQLEVPALHEQPLLLVLEQHIGIGPKRDYGYYKQSTPKTDVLFRLRRTVAPRRIEPGATAPIGIAGAAGRAPFLERFNRMRHN